MKSAEDFRNAFGSADARFELVVHNTLEDLQRQNEKTEQGRKHRYLFPAIAVIMILMLGIGIAASNGRWGVLNWLSENRGESTGQPTVSETAEPFMATTLRSRTAIFRRINGVMAQLPIRKKPTPTRMKTMWSILLSVA